jgi:hypothetical protein
MPSVTNRQSFKEYCYDNKYSKWYFSIIEKAKERNWCKKYRFVYDNEKVEVFNLRKFCRDNNLDQGAMVRVNSEKQKTHKGYSKCRM